MIEYKETKDIIDNIINGIIKITEDLINIIKLQINFEEYINNNYINWTIPKIKIDFPTLPRF